jgi:hypothetical protein
VHAENKQVIESLQKMGDEFHDLGPDDFAKYWRKDYQVCKDMAKMFGKEPAGKKRKHEYLLTTHLHLLACRQQSKDRVSEWDEGEQR